MGTMQRRTSDVPIDPETGEPVEVDTPNEVCSTWAAPPPPHHGLGCNSLNL